MHAMPIAVTTAVVCSVGLLPASALPTELPPRSIKHQNSQYWSWAGPRNWVSADGAYGITIVSGNGLLTNDYGFSSILCGNGASVQESVANYFAGQRSTLRQSLRSNWRRVAVDSSRIRQLPEAGYGPLYFRQGFAVSGRAEGRDWRGEVILDYSLASGPTYCFARNQSRTAPAQGFRTSIRQLRSVQDSIAYFGPGVPGGSPNQED
ncbi:MAG: hypothetical protein MUD05_01725 [Candidatus Nanopelagicales bacterium]|nr:hypothetical protein [Candidatus Nanopelagicales bacterium]